MRCKSTYLKVSRAKYANKKTTGAPLELVLKAVLTTLIMTTPRGNGMKPILRETASHWSANACNKYEKNADKNLVQCDAAPKCSYGLSSNEDHEVVGGN